MTKARQKGHVLVITAALLVVILGIAALAVDMGMLYTARTSAQHIADASALAGAYTFLNPVLTPSQQPSAAKNAAQAAAKDASGNPLSVQGQPVTLTVADSDVTLTPQRTVTATVSVSVPTFFAKALSISQANIKTTATAEAAKEASGTSCMKPFWILNSQDKGYNADGSCKSPLVTGGVTTNNFTPGQDVTIYGKSGPSNYGLVNPNSYDGSMAGECNGNGGARDVNTAITSCYPGASCDANLTMCKDSGGKVSHIDDNMNQLIGAPNADSFVAVGQYRNPASGVTSDTSRSLITIVIWDDCGGCVPSPGSTGCGKTGFSAIGFGEVFVTNVDQKLVTGKLVSLGTCGVDNHGSGGTGPYAIPVRLVNKN